MVVKRLGTLLLCFTLTVSQSPSLWAERFNINDLPVPGRLVAPAADFVPLTLKGLAVYPQDPLKFDFIMDTGNSHLAGRPLKQEATKIIKYFLTALTIPEDDVWVNLSPYEKTRIIENDFGTTIMGRDLLAEDYVLKQLAASLIYPEHALGKKFWQQVYQKASRELGTTKIPVNTFNKVWIVPSQAVVWQHEGKVLIVKSHLKVMLEEDYLALEKHQRQPGDMFKPEQQRTCPQAGCQADKGLNAKAPQGNNLNALGSQILREIVIPELEKQVNEGANFSPLRQMFQAMILSAWYKKAMRKSIINKAYADQKKVKGLDTINPADVQSIYQRYIQAFKKGAFNYIKEDPIPDSPPRKYFSGGFSLRNGVSTLATALLILTGSLSPSVSLAVDHAVVAEGKTILVEVKGDLQGVKAAAQTPKDRFINESLQDRQLVEEWRKGFMLASAGGIATTITALRNAGIWELFKDPDQSGHFRAITMKDMVEKIEKDPAPYNTPHRGFLHGVMHILSMMGWLNRSEGQSNDRTEFTLTLKGKEALKYVDYYVQVSELMPEALDLKDYLDGKPVKDSRGRFSLENLVLWLKTNWKDFPSFENKDLEKEIKAQLVGFVLGPLMIQMSKRKILQKFDDKNANLRLKDLTDTDGRPLSGLARQRWQAAFRLLRMMGYVNAEWSTFYLTNLGAVAFRKALVWGTPVSYYRTYSHAQDLLFGNANVIWKTDAEGHEYHVDREPNVEGSGFSHHQYFEALHGIVDDVIERQMESGKIPKPDQITPSKPYTFRIADTGSGDGSLLEELYRHITKKTASYGNLMQQYPDLYKIEMVGIDFNKKARDVTDKRLRQGDIPHKVLFGDISDPRGISENLKRNFDIDMKKDINLHVRSFLDHNRLYLGFEDKEFAAKRTGLSQAVFSDREGNLIPNNELEQNLFEHFKRWLEFTDELVIIELHNIPPEEAANNLDTSLAISYALSHLYSSQYIVEAFVFHVIANQAGFKRVYTAAFPKTKKDDGTPTGRSPAVTVTHFQIQDHLNHAMRSVQRRGGIDFTQSSANLSEIGVSSPGDGSGGLAQLQDASGFVPIVISIQPLSDLYQFFDMLKK